MKSGCSCVGFFFYQFSNHCSVGVFFVQIFEGNTHYDTPELRHFEETVAQYVRLYPERWSPAGIGMRVEILGCDLPGRTLGGDLFDTGSFYIHI